MPVKVIQITNENGAPIRVYAGGTTPTEIVIGIQSEDEDQSWHITRLEFLALREAMSAVDVSPTPAAKSAREKPPRFKRICPVQRTAELVRDERIGEADRRVRAREEGVMARKVGADRRNGRYRVLLRSNRRKPDGREGQP